MENKKSPIALRIISSMLLIGWMGLIFYLSHQNADDSSLLSGGLIEKVIGFLFPNMGGETLTSLIESLQFIVRKGAHFTIYAILGVLSFITFVTYNAMPIALRSFLSFLVSVVYSISDEYHQTFVKGRSGEIRDVLIDSAGALLGIILSLVIYAIHNAIKERGSSKMRKKQYIELTESLTNRLRSEKQINDELRAENEALNKQLAELREQIVALSKTEKTVVDAEPIAIKPQTVAEPEKKTVSFGEIELSDGVNDGAKIIGKIVLSSAEYCNKLTDVGASENAKELVNLILGRTEVAKGEVLRLSNLDIDPKERYLAMERELNEAEDYFKSVMAQK